MILTFAGVGCEEAVESAEGRLNTHFQFGVVPRMSGSPGELVLELIYELGALEGDRAFGRIQDLAASDDSLVAVADRFGCLIRVFEFPSRTLRSEIGGCGEGPGEFLNIMNVAFESDTLVVFDYGKRRIMWLDLDGEELRSEELPSELAGAPFIHSLDVRGDRMIYSPAWQGTSQLDLLHVRWGDGRTRSGVPDAEISVLNRDLSMVRWVPACLFRSRPAVAIANRWALQAVILAEDLEPQFNHVDEAAWYGPASERDGEWWPGFGMPGLACGDDLAIWTYSKAAPRQEQSVPRIERGVVLVASASGRLVMREVVADTAWPHVATMTAAAGLGDVFFFYANQGAPYPIVQGYRVAERVQ